jgi:hypothetical protein
MHKPAFAPHALLFSVIFNSDTVKTEQLRIVYITYPFVDNNLSFINYLLDEGGCQVKPETGLLSTRQAFLIYTLPPFLWRISPGIKCRDI